MSWWNGRLDLTPHSWVEHVIDRDMGSRKLESMRKPLKNPMDDGEFLPPPLGESLSPDVEETL